MKTKTAIIIAFLIPLFAAAMSRAQAAETQSGTEIFSNAAADATALSARAQTSLARDKNTGETVLDSQTMSQLTALARKIYSRKGDAQEKGNYWHTRFTIQINADDLGGVFSLRSIVIGVKPWTVETKCKAKPWRKGPCLYAQFSSLKMTAVIYPGGAMTVSSDPGFGEHTQEGMIHYAKDVAVGFWLGRFSKPVFNPLF